MKRSTVVFWALLAAALLVTAVLSGGRRTSGPPLDPGSTDPLGTRALTELLDDFGAEVRLGLPDDQTTVTLVLSDSLTAGQRADVGAWVEAGGRLVVADAGSELGPSIVEVSPDDRLDRGTCTIDDLTDVGSIEASTFLRFATGSGDGSCFGDAATAYLVQSGRGAGTVTSLGGAFPFTNRHLDEADNAVLAARLLLVGDDPGVVTIVYDPVVAVGERSLADLVPTAVRWLGWQLLVAFGAFVVWKAWRFGRVVDEPQLVELPGSLSVRASAELRRRTGAHGEAGVELRQQLERRIRSELRIGPDLPTEELVRTVSAQTGADAELLAAVLDDQPVTDGAELGHLVDAIDQVTEQVFVVPTR